MTSANRTGAILTVDLNVLAKNFAYLKSKLNKGVDCSAVVKSDAYGLGLEPIVVRLSNEGCNKFFVAMLDEAIAVREILKKVDKDASIYMLNGLPKDCEKELDHYNVIPILNSIKEIECWSAFAKVSNQIRHGVINIDTGMSRLGLDNGELQRFALNPQIAEGINITHVMSHLACADNRMDNQNEQQRRLFDNYASHFGSVKLSLANSAGIFLGDNFHYDLVRPGAAIYGLQPIRNEINKIHQTIELKAKIIQTFFVDANATVGYGATFRTTRKSRLATVSIGYGDGYFRSLGSRGYGYIGKIKVPIVGRISMDLITFDVIDVREKDSSPGAMIELIGPNYTVDRLAMDAGTIGYEILTSLGSRYSRNYIS